MKSVGFVGRIFGPAESVVTMAGVALAACLLVIMTSSGPALATAPPGEDGRIAYFNHDEKTIYTMPSSGGTPTKVVTHPTYALSPSFSPDGETIAYSVSDGNNGDDIYTIPSGGGTPTKLTNTTTLREWAPTFSPDGETIVYQGYDGTNKGDIYTMPSGGGTPTKLTNTTTLSEGAPAFSPDGQKIAYSGYDGTDSDIYTMPSGGGTPTKLTTNTTLHDGSPTFSPDGQTIAYTSWGESRYCCEEIYTMPSGGGTPTKLTTNITHAVHPTFSPDGQKIVYQGSDGYDWEIYTMPSSGGTSTKLTDNLSYDGTPDWTAVTLAETLPETVIDSGPEGPISDHTPTFTFSGSDNVSTSEDLRFSYKVDNEAWSEYSSQRSVTLGGSGGLSDGQHTFYVRAKDAAGNVDASPAARTITVDTTAPDTAISSGPSGLVKGSMASFAFSSPNDASATFECLLDATDDQKADGSGWSACSSPKEYNALTDGQHTFEVRAKDAAGNVDASPAERTFTVDTSAPRVTATTPGGTTVARDTPLTATFSERMNPDTLTKATFKLFKVNTDGTRTRIFNTTVTLSTDGLSATLDPFGEAPDTLLRANTKYKAIVTTKVTDSVGNALDQNSSRTGNQSKVWTFTTGSS